MPRLTETRALRATLPHTGQALIWCSEIRGFGCRIMPTGVRAWFVQLRHHSSSMRLTLGRVGTLPFEGPPDRPGATDLAKIALNAARRGEDPKLAIGRAQHPRGVTLGELWKAYGAAGYPLASGHGVKRASSIKVDGYRWAKHFARIGGEPATNFDDPRTQRWLDTIAGMGAGAQALLMLKTLLSFGASRGLCDPHKITLTARPSRKVQNFLKPAELKCLDNTLIEMIAEQPKRIIGLAAIRMLLHTGMRKGEVLTLDWSMIDIDHRVIHLPKDKASDTGRDVLLTHAAIDVLRSLPKMARGGWVFFGRRRQGHLVDLERYWGEALDRADLRRIRIHDLRHSFAATAIGKGTSLYVTGKLLGHRSSRTTERYAHLSAEAEREALDRVAGALS
jgi:integrase